jgi:hypothetical protein
MKKLLILLSLSVLLVSCKSYSSKSFRLYSETDVDGYFVYEKTHNDFFCKTYYEDIYYSGKDYNYGLSFIGCSPDMTFFILVEDEYVYLHDALDQELISLESLMPLLKMINRDPEIISDDKTDYYWLDFWINDKVVYAHAGGKCGQTRREYFTINNQEYYYEASGCMEDNILYMQIEGEYVSMKQLINEGIIDAEYIIPLLIESD